MATHEEWQKARDRRNMAALQAVRSLLDGKIDQATGLALESVRADDDMDRISEILDGK